MASPCYLNIDFMKSLTIFSRSKHLFLYASSPARKNLLSIPNCCNLSSFSRRSASLSQRFSNAILCFSRRSSAFSLSLSALSINFCCRILSFSIFACILCLANSIRSCFFFSLFAFSIPDATILPTAPSTDTVSPIIGSFRPISNSSPAPLSLLTLINPYPAYEKKFFFQLDIFGILWRCLRTEPRKLLARTPFP